MPGEKPETMEEMRLNSSELNNRLVSKRALHGY